MRAVDAYGFAGGFTLGTVQAGFTLVGKREEAAGFGAANCDGNRDLLGYDWDLECVEPATWSVPSGGSDLVFGNPPCSGFSGLSHRDFRGMDSPINECMWNFVRYTARVKPTIAIFESVRAAYSTGIELMRALREELERLTDSRWTLYHVVHDAHALGGPAVRKRYFWVASRVAFGVEHPVLPFSATLHDAIGDLETLDHTWLPQPYRTPPTPWSDVRRSVTGSVDGHVHLDNPLARRLSEMASAVGWRQGEDIHFASKRCYEEYGDLPPAWQASKPKLIKSGFDFGFNRIARWDYTKPARVITGTGPNQCVHPIRDRPLTHRETARIMGFPDDWRIEPIKNVKGLSQTWGKGITVDAGRWIATWARRSLEGSPGALVGKEIGDREYEITVTKPNTNGHHRPDIVVLSYPSKAKGLHAMTDTATDQQAQVPAPPAPPAPAPPVEQPQAQPAQAENNAPVQPPTGTEGNAEGNTETSDEKRGRGRPRSDDTIERDEKVLAILQEGPVTREDLATRLNLKSSLVYMSLYRLSRDGKIERAGGQGRGHTWKVKE